MSTEITINQDIVEINVTEQVVTIEAPSGAYPLPNLVSSVFGRVGAVVAQEGDYTLTQLGGVTITSPTNNQVLKYNGTQWVNSSDTDTGLTSVGLSMPSAFSVANSPLTANGTLSVTGAGTTAQYVRGDGSLATFPVIAQEAQRLITEVYNSTGATLAKGSIVYINGGQGNLPTVTKAIATGDATSAQTYGVVQSDITNMNNGFVVAMGSLTNLDTQIYPVGTQLYLSGTTAGAWTSVKPYAPLHLVYVGIVVRSHPTQGIVEIRIQNGYELDELHDVSAQSPTNGDILQYVAATDLWTKTAGTTTNIAEGTNLYFTDTRARAAITLTTTGTSGAATYTSGVLNIPQYQGVLTNPVTGTGTTNTLPKFTGASTIGNSNVSDSGTLITLGSNTLLNGSLGIGATPVTAFNLYMFKTLTGATTAYGIAQTGSVQSDVTTANGILNQINTQAASFTLTTYNHFNAGQGSIGAGSVVTNQHGFLAGNFTAATNNFGFRGQLSSGTNRWNIYMDGTANNYMAGGLGIGSTNIGGGNGNINIARNITGNAFSTAIWQNGTVQSDVTGGATSYQSDLKTAAASFTLTEYIHYLSNQITIGAGSVVTNQSGFYANSNLIGATNNYGFRGRIPVGTGRWNLYMDGMAANYLAGDTAIGTTTLGTATQLTVGGTETAVSAISRGQLINTTLVASANNDFLVGLDINPTFTNGAFTGVSNYALRLNGSLAFSGQNFNILSNNVNRISYNGGVGLSFLTGDSTTPIRFIVNFNESLRIFAATSNVLIQNGGTFTDAGFRLDVNGTTRFIGTASSDTAPLGAELAAVTGTGTNWTLAGTNLNVGGYTHTVGSVVPLTTALAAVNGTYYQIAYTITGRTAGTITIAYGGTSTTVSATGATGPLASSTAVLTITPTTDFDGTVVLSIKTISASAPSSTFSTSASTSNIEVRASTSANNTFIGLQTGRRNTTGTSNTFIGVIAGRENSTGTENTFIGSGAGQINITSSSNTFIGSNAGANNISVGFNTFLGNNAGLSNTLGNSNTFLGRSSGQNITTGFQNVMIGNDAGRFITGGSTSNTVSIQSIFIGVSTRAAADSQTNQIVIGNGTTGLGSNTTIIGNSSTTLTALYGSVIANGTSINASAVLQADSTTKGFLPPRMTTVQKLAIGTPAAGLMVFDTTLNQMSYFNGTLWINF